MTAQDTMDERRAFATLDDDGAPLGQHGAATHMDGPVRLRVADALHGGALDGAWWPYSREVSTELPALVAALPARAGRIAGIALNLASWTHAPLHVRLPGRDLRLGWYTRLDRDTIALTDTAGNRLLLLVIPPATAPEVADRAFASAAGAPAWTPPGQVLAAAGAGAASGPGPATG